MEFLLCAEDLGDYDTGDLLPGEDSTSWFQRIMRGSKRK